MNFIDRLNEELNDTDEQEVTATNPEPEPEEVNPIGDMLQKILSDSIEQVDIVKMLGKFGEAVSTMTLTIYENLKGKFTPKQILRIIELAFENINSHK